MKALVYTGPNSAEVRDVPAPSAKEGEVELDIQFCGVCGSDIGIYSGKHPRAKAPLVFGHEFLGRLTADGKRLRKGDRVVAFPLLTCGKCLACRTGNSHVCNDLHLIGIDRDGGMCERLCVDEDILFRVPDGVSDRAAVITEPLAVIVRAIHQAGFMAMETAAVIGAGTMGILTGIMLRYAGASKVFISDISEGRLRLAEELGMIPVDSTKEDVVETVKAATGGEGCDVVFECSGSAQAASQITSVTRVRGRICIVSNPTTPHEVDLRQMSFKELSLVGTRVYTKEEFGQAVELTSTLMPQLEKVVTHIVPLEAAGGVFDMIADPSNGTVKVAVDCRTDN